MTWLIGTHHHHRSRISPYLRSATGCALVAMLATTSLAQAQTPPLPAMCTDYAQEGLQRVGGGAEAQCVLGATATSRHSAREPAAAIDVTALSTATAALADGDDIRAQFILETK